MGGPGGALWRKITYKLPPPTPAAPASGQVNGSDTSTTSTATATIRPDAIAAISVNGHANGNSHDHHNHELAPRPVPRSTDSTSSANGNGTVSSSNNDRLSDSVHTQRGGSICGTVTVERGDGSCHQQRTPFFDYLSTQLQRYSLHIDAEDASQLPFNFWGGYVGYLGYELKAECGGQHVHASGQPDACLFLADQLIAIGEPGPGAGCTQSTPSVHCCAAATTLTQQHDVYVMLFHALFHRLLQMLLRYYSHDKCFDVCFVVALLCQIINWMMCTCWH